MNANERKKVSDAIIATADLFGRKFSDAGARMYLAVLDDLNADAVLSAMAECAKTSKFMPTPAEVRERVSGGNVADRASLAWDIYERAVRMEGPYRTVQFLDPYIGLTVKSLGGWQKCCEIPEHIFDVHHRKDFERVYGVFARRAGDPESPVLVGIHDMTNNRMGYDETPQVVVLIGDHRHNRRLIEGN